MEQIKATDLRIGNWVLANLTNTNIQVDWLVIKHVCDGNIQSVYDSSVVYSPIRLTSDLLVIMGAKCKYGNTYYIGKFKFDVSNSQLVYFVCSGKSICILYVHRLQNLIHALTGQELEFTL